MTSVDPQYDDDWFRDEEEYFRKRYGYEIHPDAKSPFGTLFLEAELTIRKCDFRVFYTKIHKLLSPILRALKAFDSEFPLLCRESLPPKGSMSAHKAFEVCMNQLGPYGFRNLGTALCALHSTIAQLHDATSVGWGAFKRGRPAEDAQGRFLHNLSILFVHKSGGNRGETNWGDCKRLIQYYYAYDSNKFFCLKRLLSAQLKKIHSKFKKKFRKERPSSEVTRYLKSPATYKPTLQLLNTHKRGR